MKFTINIGQHMNIFSSVTFDNKIFVCAYYPKQHSMYLNEFDLLIDFIHDRVPLGILLDYIEDNPYLIDVKISAATGVVPIIRHIFANALWKTVSQIATRISINE